jgi:hypothetical protein
LHGFQRAVGMEPFMEPSGSKLDSSGPNLDCWEPPGSFR